MNLTVICNLAGFILFILGLIVTMIVAMTSPSLDKKGDPRGEAILGRAGAIVFVAMVFYLSFNLMGVGL